MENSLNHQYRNSAVHCPIVLKFGFGVGGKWEVKNRILYSNRTLLHFWLYRYTWNKICLLTSCYVERRLHRGGGPITDRQLACLVDTAPSWLYAWCYRECNFCLFRVFVNCMLSKMCHNLCSAVAGHTVWTLFLLAGLLMLCTSVNAKKLTEATEENCEGIPLVL